MRRRIGLIILALFVTLCFTIVRPVAQQPMIDSQKSRQELETMEGILSTTVDYAVKRLAGNQASAGSRGAFHYGGMDSREVDGYYIYGQGAVFMIPVSALQRGRYGDFAFALGDVGELVGASVDVGLEAAAASMAALAGSEDSEAQAAKVKEKAEKLQQQAEERQKDVGRNLEKQKAKMQELQEQAKKRQAEAEQRHKELISRLGQIKVDLKDALARYGDSLSIVKPDESVTIILSEDGRFRWGDSESNGICQVLTVKKSLVTDLKAGKISREEFDRRVVDYSY